MAGINLSRIWMAALVVVFYLFTMPVIASSEPSIATKVSDALSSVYNGAVGATFTITKIDANLGEDAKKTAKKRVRVTRNRDAVQITFSDRCELQDLRSYLKFIPPVQVDWHNSNIAGNVATLRGVFVPGQRYVLVLPPDFKSSAGKTYSKTVSTFAMPDRDADIAFLDQGTVIERNSRQMLHVQIMNVNEVQFHGLQIPPALIPLALSSVNDSGSIDDIKAGLGQAARQLQKNLGQDSEFRPLIGDIIEDSQLFFAKEESNVYHQFSIPLSFRNYKEKGALELAEVVSKRHEQAADTRLRLLRITDIGITYKISDTELLIWTTSLYSGKPIPDAAIYAFTRGKEVVPLGKTDSRGLLVVQNNLQKKTASLAGIDGNIRTKELKLDSIELVVADTANDRTYAGISAAGNVKPAGINQERLAAKPSGMMKGHVFTERGIYRPGDMVYFKGTVREYKDGNIAPPRQTSVAVKIVNSKNEEIYNKTTTLSEFGTMNDQLGIKAFFPLGTYTVRMQYGQRQDEVAERSFEVQEFRQPRHFVEIVYKRESKKDDDYVNLDMKKELLNCEITGKYYAGGPVKHGKVRWSIYHTRSDYSRQDYPGYGFGHPLESRTDLIESGEAMLDEKGQLTVPIALGKDVLSGKYGIEVTASVVDFDGRASTDSSVYQSDPDYLVGISNHNQNVKPGDSQTLSAIVIDRKGSKVTRGSVTVQVMEHGYTYIQKRNAEGYLYNEQQQIWRSELSAELPIKDDRAVFDFDFTRGGDYLIAFTYKDPKGREYTSATRYSMPGYYDYDYENGGHTEQPKNYGKLSLSPEKPLYTAGETMKIFLNAPRDTSTYLVTVEQGGLLEFLTYELKPDQQYIELPVKDKYNPNVYVSVLATVPRSSFPVYTAQFDKESPSFLFGTTTVEVKGNQQKIKIAVNEEQKKLRSVPGGEMTLNIATSDQNGKAIVSELAIAVVDESVLSMTGFETPTLDILGKFLLPLGVFTGDLRLDILKQTPYGLFRNMPLTGGDGEGAASEGVSSKIRKDFNPVAYFNPSVRTDASGHASVKFIFPDSMTTYRVYAVACDKGSRFGTYQRSALVVKDFYMEPGLPAFFTRGDRFLFAVSAFNKTDRSGSVDFSVKSDQLLTLAPAGNNYSLAGFDRTLIPVEGSAIRAGLTGIQFSGRFKDYSDVVEMKVPVNSGRVLSTDTVFGNFRKMEELKYTLPKAVKELNLQEVGPDELKVILTVSGSPFLRMSQGLRYFLHYPYGCVEQTSSGVLPLAALRGIIQKNLIPDITIAETDKFIKPGIERLLSMQTNDGGFGYWPGDRITHKWGTLYAMTALTRAGLAGFDVPRDRMSKALAYLQSQIKESGKDEYTYRAFGVYILALNKALDNETFQRAFTDIDAQPRESIMLVLLAGKTAKLVTDDQAKAKLRPLLEKPWTIAERSWDEFYARYREPAIALLAAVAIMPNDELTHRAAGKLISGINPEGIWTSTSDTSWSLIALTEYFSGEKGGAKAANVSVKQGGKLNEVFTIEPGSFRTLALDAKEFLKNPSAMISTSSDQTLLYKLAVTFPRTDYAKNGYSNGFELHKTIKNTDGSSSIKVGDIVEVKVKINIKNRAPNYVVLDDPLPAGFVAINSAIKTEEAGIAKKRLKKMMQTGSDDDEEESDGEFGEGFGWSDYYWDPYGYYRFTPNFFEIRNDRVVAFRNRAWNGTYEYSYYARAVCEGEFVLPSSKVQLMYDPDVVAYTPQGKVTIKANK